MELKSFLGRAAKMTAAVAAAGALALAQPAQYSPVTDALLINPPADEWLLWRGDLANSGHSSLDQIDTENVDQLRLA